jgi:hypothetical protein
MEPCSRTTSDGATVERMAKISRGIHGGLFTEVDHRVTYTPPHWIAHDMMCMFRWWRADRAIKAMAEEQNEYWSHAWDKEPK